MFTGLIEEIGTVKNISSSKIQIEINVGGILSGDSVAVNGVCLTAVSAQGNIISFDYSPQTDSVTNLSSLKANSKVNIERALQLSSRLGGHIVSGHVDGIAKIERIEKLERFFKITFSCAQNILKYCVDRGSIAVDGISLTASSVKTGGFETFIIPQTYNNTVLSYKKIGDAVNIETDILAKYVEKFSGKKDLISLEFLKENGF
ncbi:MAG: riboflavin synthase [Endomicrobium sp.]|nr:riboflavin synthase [Endomicrobium sp.]